MRLVPAAALLFFLGASSICAQNMIEIRKASPQSKSIDIRFEASLESVVKALEIHLARPVDYLVADRLIIRFARKNVAPDAVLKEIVENCGYVLIDRGTRLEIRDPDERSVTLDVQDVEVKMILDRLKEQCAIVNMIVDREVRGKGTFLFNDVPCSAAFRTVFNTFGLAGEAQSNSVILVGVRK